MAKIKFITIIFIGLIISNCGFNASYQENNINAIINSTSHNKFTNILKERFNKNIDKSFIINIGDEKKHKRANIYLPDGSASSYKLTLSVLVEVFNQTNKLLLKEKFTAHINFDKTPLQQADNAQIKEKYDTLRKIIANKLLLKLQQLNAN